MMLGKLPCLHRLISVLLGNLDVKRYKLLVNLMLGAEIKFMASCATVLFFMLFSLRSGAENSIKVIDEFPNELLRKQVSELFTQADQLTVKYIPHLFMEHPFVRRKDLGEKWKYMFSYRCTETCEKNAESVQDYLSSGLRLGGECPDPFFARIEFFKSSELIAVIAIQETGQCFVLSGRSFHAPYSFDRFLDSSRLYPDFVK